MKFYTFGKEESPVILLLPGTCCHWKLNFEPVIPYLERDFKVVCVSYDGFDETEETVFPDMIAETEKIEAYILENYGGRICAAYGCSLGGSFVGLLIQRGRIHIDHGILGSSDLDQAGKGAAALQAWLITKVLHGMLRDGKLPGWMQRRMQKRGNDEYMDAMLRMFGIGGTKLCFVKKESIRNQFYSDLVTPLEDQISAPGTVVHCFFAAKMGEKYLKRYEQHFKSPDIVRHELQHEELLVCYPEKWAQQVKECCMPQA